MSEANEPTAGGFREGVHILPVRVYYEDTDFTGVVYHANYLRYLERGRTDFLRVLGIHHQALWQAEDAAAFAIRKLSLEFFKPARIDDALEIRTRPQAVKGASLILGQSVARGAEILVTAEVQAVCIGRDGRPRRAPEDLQERLKPFLEL